MVLHGERTKRFRTLGPFELLPPIKYLRNGNKTPAMSRMEVKVFSRISAPICQMVQT